MTGNISGNIDWTVQPCTTNTRFESMAHSGALLSGLNRLRCCGLLLDVTLLVENIQFKVHRAVLAACSDYFRAMFTDAMKESQQAEICLKGVTARGMELVIDYAYTSNLELNLLNIQDILSAATHVQMEPIVDACSFYLENQIDLDNCIDIATIADLYSLEKLKQKTYRFICAHLKEFSRSSEINRFTSDQMEHLLRSDYPVDCSEGQVLQIVLQWCKATNCDVKTAQKLFYQVRFQEIRPEELERIIFPFHKMYHSIIRATAEHLNPVDMQKPSEDVLTNSRGMELALLKIGGFGLNGITNHISYYLPSRKKWHNLTVIPHVEQCNYGTAVLGNDLYIVGGCYDVCLKEYIHPFGFRYCPTDNKWSTIAPMQTDRCRFTLNALGNYLYAVGGASEVNENDETEDNWAHDVPISNCERYNAKTDKWEYIPPLVENRTQHAGVIHRFDLYVSGGLDRHRILSSLWKFNTFQEKWEELSPMLTPRVDHAMLLIRDKLYVCGGWHEDLLTENRRLVDTIDVYDIQKNSWSVETTIPNPKYHAGVVSVNSKIYFIGGLHSDNILDRASSSMHCYDLDLKEWSKNDRYPQRIWECTCVTLYVPRCREDVEVVEMEVVDS